MARKSKKNKPQSWLYRFRPTILILVAFILTFGIVSLFFDSPNKTNESKQQAQKQNAENAQKESQNQKLTTPSQQTYVVVKGDSLSKIAEKYYGDKMQWKLLAAENQISDPDQIDIGDQLTIPNLEKQTSSIATQQLNERESSRAESSPKTYTVTSGDTLWEISQHFYSGDGYQWYKIRDANSTKVGLLASGRPLITPGTILTIPPA